MQALSASHLVLQRECDHDDQGSSDYDDPETQDRMMRGASTGGLFSVPSLSVSNGSPFVWRRVACFDYQR